MKPYYEHDGIRLYHGDCRVILPELGPVDAVITDPPYGETSLEWDRQVSGWMNAAAAVTRSVWCFGSFRFFMKLVRSGECRDWNHAQEIVWEKHNGSGFLDDRFKRVHELAVQFYRGEWESVYKSPVMTLDETPRTVRRKTRPTHIGHIEKPAYTSEDGGPRMMRSVIYARSCHGSAEHPTQKPEAILSPLIEYSIPPGGICADAFAGSGSTLVAARAAGRRGIGIEIDEAYCEVAARRLDRGVQPLLPMGAL